MMEVQTPQTREAFDVERSIKEHIQDIRLGWIVLAGALYRFTEGKMWSQLGYESLNEWLAGPDIELERRMVQYLCAAWRELVVNRGVKPAQLAGANISKINAVLPAIKEGNVEVEDALSDARQLTRKDLIVKYQDEGAQAASGGEEPERCPTCGQVVKQRDRD